MRGKVAKRLRKTAKSATVGKPALGWIKHKITSQIFNHPQTTRGVYRLMKKAFRSGAL